jgi:hypothetical protein
MRDNNAHRWLWKALVAFAVLIYAALAVHSLRETVNDPAQLVDFRGNDSVAYLEIAKRLAAGDFSMEYVKVWPHRQPLFPLLLSPVLKCCGTNPYLLGLVNIVVVICTFYFVYACLAFVFHRRLVAFAGSALLLFNPFMFYDATTRLLTEPIHVFIMCGILMSLLCYLESEAHSWALLAAAVTGFDYLSRPNGLFVMGALLAVIVLALCLKQDDQGVYLSVRKVLSIVALCLCMLGVFIIIAIPSWIPRLIYMGNPVQHGYLSNFMWVDDYYAGHTGRPYQSYFFEDYAATHSVWDAIVRFFKGAVKVLISIPMRADFHAFPFLCLTAFAGILLALWRGPFNYRLLLLFGFMQLLPLIWTSRSNSTMRVPYSATLPFLVFFSAFFLNAAIECPFCRQLLAKVRAVVAKRAISHTGV